MGRKPKVKIEGKVDWQIKVLYMPKEVIEQIKHLAITKHAQIGDFLCKWTVAGAKREEKRIKD